MGIFDAQYPQSLQQVIDHAERFIALLASANAHSQALNDLARAWLKGRAEEIETAVGGFVAEWRSGQLPEPAAVVAVSSYLEAMHAGAERYLGMGAEAACCRTDVPRTLPLPPSLEDPATADTLPGSPAALADARTPED